MRKEMMCSWHPIHAHCISTNVDESYCPRYRAPKFSVGLIHSFLVQAAVLTTRWSWDAYNYFSDCKTCKQTPEQGQPMELVHGYAVRF